MYCYQLALMVTALVTKNLMPNTPTPSIYCKYKYVHIHVEYTCTFTLIQEIYIVDVGLFTDPLSEYFTLNSPQTFCVSIGEILSIHTHVNIDLYLGDAICRAYKCKPLIIVLSVKQG